MKTNIHISTISTVLLIICWLTMGNNAYAQDKNMDFFNTMNINNDESEQVLIGDARGADIASIPPEIDFALFDIDPDKYGIDYGHWGNVVYGPDSKYYVALGNHAIEDGGNGGSLLVSYYPRFQLQEIHLFSHDELGHQNEGKWHGRPDIHPVNGDMWLIGYNIGQVLKYNIFTEELEIVDRPDPSIHEPEGGFWGGYPEHVWDWNRGLLYGNGRDSTLLVYDTNAKEALHTGDPVESATGERFKWEFRSRFLNRNSGILYATAATTHRVVSYNPATNEIKKHDHSLEASLRAWSEYPDNDGAYWWFDRIGNMYQYWPEEDRLVHRGKNWGDEGVYVTFLEISPDRNYLYYALANDNRDPDIPVIQYDINNDRKKVIAFLGDYYREQYGYDTGRIYGGALNEDGTEFFVTANGRTIEPDERRQSMFLIHIPEEEQITVAE